MATKTFKFRLYPTKEQETRLSHWLALMCELYNAALQERRDAYQIERKSISYADQNRQLTEIKSTNPEYKDINSHALQDVLMRLDKAMKAFFRRVKTGEKAGFPRFKPKSRFRSFSVPNTRYSIKGNKLFLSRLGDIKMRQDCPIEGVMKTAAIKNENGKWFVCIAVEFEPVPLPVSDKEIGIDIGLKNFAALSNGEYIENPRYYAKLLKKLRTAQRRVSRRKKGSHRRKKAVKILANVHLKIRNQRADYLHKASRKIVNEYGVIAVAPYSIKEMATDKHFAGRIYDAAWGIFLEKLKYKAENAGRKFIEVDNKDISQVCVCGNPVPKKLTDRWHKCDKCGLSADRDYVSANLIKLRAFSQSVQPLT